MHRNLQGNGVYALAHLCPAVTHFNSSVFSKANDCPVDFFEPIAKTTVFKSKSKTDCLTSSAGFVVSRLNCGEAFGRAETTIVHDLSWAPHPTRHDDVSLTHRPPIDASFCCQSIHYTFHCELSLVCTEAAKGTAHGIVGAHCDGFDVDVWNFVRTTCMTGHAFEHLHTDTGVCARISDCSHV